MTINTTITESGPFVGTGSADTYAYSFRILLSSQIKVVETLLGGAAVTLVEGTDYSVTGVGDSGGGNVVRTAGNLPTGATWLISRVTAQTQGTDFPGQGAFTPESHEDAFDKMTMLLQERDTDLARAIQSPLSEVAIDLFLPLVAARQGMLLEFDSAGLPAVSVNAASAAAAIAAALASGTAMTVDTFTGDDSTVAFVISVAPASVNGMLVTVDGVVQAPTTDFTVAGTTVTFNAAPPNLSAIVIRNLGNSSSIIQVNLRGQETLVAGVATVTFAVAESNANYRLSLTGDINETFFFSAKTTAGFTINSSNGSSTANVDWLLSR